MSSFQLTTNKKQPRNIWGEIFRIFCILTILFRHFQSYNSFNPTIVDLARIGVLGFVLISGFYSIDSTEWRTKKMLVKTIIYTIWGFVIFGTMYACNVPGSKSPIIAIFGFFPADKYTSWWFLYIYLAFTLFQPFINKFIHKFRKWIVFGIILVFSLCTTAINIWGGAANPPIYGVLTFNQLFVFAWVYASAGWISKHYGYIFENKQINKKLVIVAICAILFVINFYGTWYYEDIFKWLGEHHIGGNFLSEVFPYLSALTAFIIFISMPRAHSKVASKIFTTLGESTLPLYLLHGAIWGLLDLAKWDYNFWLKLLIYILIAYGISILFNFFVMLQENGVWYLINKIKTHFIKIK